MSDKKSSHCSKLQDCRRKMTKDIGIRMPRSGTTTVLLLLFLTAFVGKVNGHGYLYSPRSLNWRAVEDGITWGEIPGKTIKEYCHHCLNVKAANEVCGNSGNKNYDNFLDSVGNPMPWKTEATYKEGSVIEVKSYLEAHHWGHLEMKVCTDWENPTQACFDANPLMYVRDAAYANDAPVHENYPHYGPYSIAEIKDYTHLFKLPEGVSGNKVLFQYHYITANSCNPPGYLDYPWPGEDWWSGNYLGNCNPPPYPLDGSRPSGAPEQFWNCAQVSITPAGDGTPTDSPTDAPTETPDDPGTATTTRYWDCAGGACGCAYLPDHLSGNNELPAHCYSNAMFEAPPGNEYGATFYGTAAVSEALDGGDWLGGACNKCWKVTGTCNVNDCQRDTTTLVLKGANFCPPTNAPCNNNKAHFDIAAPGFDVHAFSLANDCKKLEPTESAGFEACGGWMIDVQDSTVNCQCDFFKDPVLKKGCENFLSLGWDNPQVDYEQVACPDEMVTPCWEENDNGYPPFMDPPQECFSPTPITEAPTPTPDPDQCESDEFELEVKFQADKKSHQDNQIVIQKLNDKNKWEVEKKWSKITKKELFEKSICLKGCYRFQLTDKKNSVADGSFVKLYLNDYLILENAKPKFKKKKYYSSKFGSCESGRIFN